MNAGKDLQESGEAKSTATKNKNGKKKGGKKK
jgi:hypothetical protein